MFCSVFSLPAWFPLPEAKARPYPGLRADSLADILTFFNGSYMNGNQRLEPRIALVTGSCSVIGAA
jgi:hypothetical protein